MINRGVDGVNVFSASEWVTENIWEPQLCDGTGVRLTENINSTVTMWPLFKEDQCHNRVKETTDKVKDYRIEMQPLRREWTFIEVKYKRWCISAILWPRTTTPISTHLSQSKRSSILQNKEHVCLSDCVRSGDIKRSEHDDWCYHGCQHVLESLAGIPQIHTVLPPSLCYQHQSTNYNLYMHGNTKPHLISNLFSKPHLQTRSLVGFKWWQTMSFLAHYQYWSAIYVFLIS